MTGVIGVDDQNVGALQFLAVEILVLQNRPVGKASPDFFVPQVIAAGDTDRKGIGRFLKACRVVVGKGKGALL